MWDRRDYVWASLSHSLSQVGRRQKNTRKKQHTRKRKWSTVSRICIFGCVAFSCALWRLFTLNIFWGKIFPPRENWVNFPSKGKFSLWRIIFPGKSLSLSLNMVSHEIMGLRKRSLYGSRENLWLSPASEDLPQAIFCLKRVMGRREQRAPESATHPKMQILETVHYLGIANRGVPGRGFQIVERAAFSSCGNLLLQGNSYWKSTLRLLLRRRVWGQICYLKTPPSENPPFDLPKLSQVQIKHSKNFRIENFRAPKRPPFKSLYV